MSDRCSRSGCSPKSARATRLTTAASCPRSSGDVVCSGSIPARIGAGVAPSAPITQYTYQPSSVVPGEAHALLDLGRLDVGRLYIGRRIRATLLARERITDLVKRRLGDRLDQQRQNPLPGLRTRCSRSAFRSDGSSPASDSRSGLARGQPSPAARLLGRFDRPFEPLDALAELTVLGLQLLGVARQVGIGLPR